MDWLGISTEARIEIIDKIVQLFADERYVDPAGTVWVGFGEAPDEIWVTEPHDDDGSGMSKEDMLVKMANEIMTNKLYS